MEALAWSGIHCAPDRDRHRLALDGDPTFTHTWLYRRGHRVAPEAAPTDLPMNRIPVGRIDGAGELLLPHLGDTLAWDGERITVESTPDRAITRIAPLNERRDRTR